MSEVSKYRDDLPTVSISRLRALDIITPETTTFRVHLGHVEQNVSVHLRKFPSGGSWSWFGCPMCGKWARTLRLHLDDIVCPGCCKRRGIRRRADTMSVRQRAERRIPQLRAMLESETPLRLKPSTLWGKLERRSRLETALKRCEFRMAQARSPRKTKTIVDPCEEPDFKPPKRPWPRLKSRLSESG